MIYRIYCWYWKKVDRCLDRTIATLRKREELLEKRYRSEINALVEKVIMHGAVWGPLTFQSWYDCFWKRGCNRCDRLAICKGWVTSWIEIFEDYQCEVMLRLPHSYAVEKQKSLAGES